MIEIKHHIDHFSIELISGWVDAGGAVEALLIELNGKRIGELSATWLRPDLRDSGYGDGRRGFTFPLRGYLISGMNDIRLKVGETQIFAGRLPYYDSGSASGAVVYGINDELLSHSQVRWKGESSPEDLTWGKRMDAESLWDIYQAEHRFTADTAILEIGPGYGRLLQTALKRKLAFSSYIGVDLSASSIAKLRGKFVSKNIRLIVGDVNLWQGSAKFQAILCSVTFDFLFPDCRVALANLASQIDADGTIMIDFVPSEVSSGVFEPDGTYLRKYTQSELTGLFDEAGLKIHKFVNCPLGEAKGKKIERVVVVATRGDGQVSA